MMMMMMMKMMMMMMEGVWNESFTNLFFEDTLFLSNFFFFPVYNTHLDCNFLHTFRHTHTVLHNTVKVHFICRPTWPAPFSSLYIHMHSARQNTSWQPSSHSEVTVSPSRGCPSTDYVFYQYPKDNIRLQMRTTPFSASLVQILVSIVTVILRDTKWTFN